MASLRVLVVDDEHLIVETVAEVLSWDGHEVDRAGDGAEALARISERRPDIVVIDLMMPTLDGNATIAKLRADSATADLPIVLMTAAPPRMTDGGAHDALLVKPFDVVALRTALANALAARKR